MSHVLRQPRILLALLCSAAAICLGMIGPRGAEATWSGYCTVTLGSYGQCIDSTPRAMHQVYGWGDQHSVCVQAANLPSTRRCSSGPGAGVYSPVFEEFTWYPRIDNNAAGTNSVHGLSFTQ